MDKLYLIPAMGSHGGPWEPEYDVSLVPALQRGNAYYFNPVMDSHGGPWEPEYEVYLVPAL